MNDFNRALDALNSVVARRVRACVGNLLDGAFNGAQIVADLVQTGLNHCSTLSALNLPTKISAMFTEEAKRVADALAVGGTEMLKILPGKHLLGMLAGALGLSNTSELTSLVVRSLDRKRLKENDPLFALGVKVETALLAYLPPRQA
jgi:hypothetical protein